MLVSLRIQKLAIMDSVFLEFHPGFNVITGETGAGKSILLDALDLLLGARASADAIRANEKKAEVEGVFDIRSNPCMDVLRELDWVDEEEPLLIIRRIIDRGGRNRVTVNGRQVTTQMLRSITGHLVELSTQHAQYALLSPENHQVLLDRFGKCESIASEFSEKYLLLQSIRNEITNWRKLIREREERGDFLRFQLDELAQLDPQEGEEDALEQRLRILRHGSRLARGLDQASNQLSGDSGSAGANVQEAIRHLVPLVEVDTELNSILDRLSQVQGDLEDMAYELARKSGSVEMDPQELQSCEERLSALRRLMKKHGPTLEQMVLKRNALEETLEQYDRLDTVLAELNEKQDVAWGEAREMADQWSAIRKQAGESLSRSVERELSHLALPKCRFRVRVEPRLDGDEKPVLGETGGDQIAFEIAPNPGEGFNELGRIASGGELSRILLAIKSVLVDRDPVGTSVYDEVDSGVGGATAEQVGRKLKMASRDRQVIAISHMAQTVAFGDRHFHVCKDDVDGRTRTEVLALSEGERAEEMARMLGGVNLTLESRQHAQTMLDSSLSWVPPTPEA